MNLPALSDTIGEIDRSLGQAASRAVNTLLTARNWLIGFYIVEYEHDGEDRAEYGKSLTEELAKRLDTKGLSSRNLWLFRQFHLAYPQIGLAFTDHPRILQSLTAVPGNPLQPADNQPNEILHTVSADSDFEEKNESSGILHPLGAELNQSVRWKKALAERSSPHVSGPKLFAKLSFTHFKALLPINGPLNTYLNYYRAEVMAPDDNPPVGLLLVAEKNNPLVEYATAGMDENLFVKKYLLQLPDKATLANFLNQELNSL